MAGNSESGDILMRFVGPDGPLPGESSTTITAGGKRRTMLEDFSTNYMFELESFTFSVNVDDDGGGQPPGPRPGAVGASAPGGARAAGHGPGPAAGPATSFSAWRTGRHHKYPIAVQPVEIKRPMDTTSGLLLQHCINCTSFRSASLVKLKPAGSAAAGEVYLRIDFTGVLLTDVSWSNDEPVTTSCKFISRKVRLRYRPQLPDGSLGAVKSGFWSMNPRDTEDAS